MHENAQKFERKPQSKIEDQPSDLEGFSTDFECHTTKIKPITSIPIEPFVQYP